MLDIILFKGSVQWKLRWVYNSSICWILASNCGAGHFLIINSPLPCNEHNSISGQYSKIYRWVLQQQVKRGAQVFKLRLFFCIPYAAPILWCCDLYSANRRSMASMKNTQKYYYRHCECAPLRPKAWRVRPASPISAGRHAAPILLAVYSI
jgi:hypothetical protein